MSSLRNQPKMRTYLLFKKDFGMETYITKISNLTIRKTISKFRLSDHKLLIETQRYQRPNPSPDQRICTTCREKEDELHCIMRCKLNKLEREKTFAYISLHNKCFNGLDETAKFIFLLQNDQICDQHYFSL